MSNQSIWRGRFGAKPARSNKANAYGGCFWRGPPVVWPVAWWSRVETPEHRTLLKSPDSVVYTRADSYGLRVVA